MNFSGDAAGHPLNFPPSASLSRARAAEKMGKVEASPPEQETESMRWLLIMLAVGAAGTAGYLGTVAKNSFSAYSRAQLDMLEHELTQQRPNPEQRESLASNQELLQEERRRRLFFYASLGVAGLATVAAFFVRGSSSATPSLRGSRDEDSRLLAAMGDPAVLREGARQKAAALLGVSPEAPPTVIEAALQAQLQQRDPARMEGLAPDLKKLVLQQREELVRARDLLLNRSPTDSRGG
jgi:hypothetical protein